MKRFRRWLFNGLTAVSLVLCVVSAAILVRSEFVSEALMKKHYNRVLHQYETTGFGWINGRVVFDREITVYPPPYDDEAAWPPDSTDYQRLPAATARASPASGRWLWFEHNRKPVGFGKVGVDESVFDVHTSLIFFAATILPVIWTRRVILRRLAERIGLCPRCGYDLRATPERCPECGTIPAKP